ncbi:MAG: glycosyltransferase family 2 protein [bacterium]
MTQNNEKISIVVAVYNEEENIQELYNRLKKTLLNDFSNFSHEIIIIDDGSTDSTFIKLAKIKSQDPTVTGIQLSRNFGHHIALTAGLENATGTTIVMMDGDLQDQPEEIIKLYNKQQEGYDLVIGTRKERKDNIIKKYTSIFGWWFLNKLSGLNMQPNQAMLRIFNMKVLKSLQAFKELNRNYPGIFAWIGYKQTTLPIEHAKRFKGKTKYSFKKMISLTLNATLGFSNKPLYYICYCGLTISSLSIVYGIYVLLIKVVCNQGIIGWSSMMVLLSFIGGIILFSLGVIGLYIGRLYQETLNRPLYIINEKI